MFRKLIRKYKYLKLRAENEKHIKEKIDIPKSIVKVKDLLNDAFIDCSDFVLREIETGNKQKIIIAYLEGLVSKDVIGRDIVKPLIASCKEVYTNDISIINQMKNQVNVGNVIILDDFQKAITGILSGMTIIFLDDFDKALQADSSYSEKRAVEEPKTEAVIRGPKEGFTESHEVNLSLIRRKVRNNNLKMENMIIGEQTNTNVTICYIKGIAKQEVVETVKERLKTIKTDAILASGYVEEFIEDSPYSLFPTVGNTEKPDKVAGKILEGRVAIICEGTPVVLTVPFLFIESIQSSEDYYSRFYFSSLLRFARIIALFITILAPAIYIALICFHQDLIPYDLMLAVASSRKGVPFSPFIEAVIITISFELIREAGIRMPQPIGQAVSIVGALVLGQAAVEAGLVSNLMVIVVAITGICSFINPPMNEAVAFIRVFMMIAANILGLVGIFLVGKAFLIHLCTLKSFNVDYMSPVSPINTSGLKDAFIRMPLWKMRKRPQSLANADARYRMEEDIKKV